jgi:hypothetical protein
MTVPSVANALNAGVSTVAVAPQFQLLEAREWTAATIDAVPNLWPPKWLPTFSFHLGPGPADVAQIAVTERCQLPAHADPSSPLRYGLARGDERRTDTPRMNRKLFLESRTGA